MSNSSEGKEESTQNQNQNPRVVHLLVFPFPASGHIIPLVDLTRRLLSRYNNLTITVVVTTPSSISLLQPLLSTFHPSQLQTLLLSPPPPSSLPSSHGLASKIRTYEALSEPITSWFESHPSPPQAIISDFFLGWTHTLASNLGIPRVVFYPSGAFASSVMCAMWRVAPTNPSDNPSFEVRFDDVPSSPLFKWSELSQLFRTGRAGDADWEFLRDSMLSNLKSWGAVFNSFSELERVYVDHFKYQMGHDRVWAVGPLLPDEEADSDPASQRGGTSSALQVQEVLTWLDQKPDRSVVYICFGSRTELSQDESTRLADALESSRVHFIWCVRDSGIIPDLDYEKGFIIRGWAPQLVILRHRAVGAFLTHCGWNSVVESISAGVMMLAWPMGADQYSNAQLVVGQLGLGLQIQCDGPDGVPDADELARLLTDSVSPTRPERGRVMGLSEAAVTAVKGGGSSIADLDDFVGRLSELLK